ncbi:hypothetical protein ACFFF8_21425, partial [Novosphingobium clariflavum]
MTFKNMIQDATFQRLRANWDQQQPLKGTPHEQDFVPVCKLFNLICPPLSGPETMIVWTTKGTMN